MSLPKRARTLHVLCPQAAAASSEFRRKVTIGKLSDEVLLRISHCFLDSSPRSWPILVHICRKWRHLIFASHRDLHLWLFCTHGTPVSKALDCWPALPIVVEYGGYQTLNPPAPEDERNILAALKRSDRVRSIHLTVTKSLLKKLPSIRGEFSELEDLVLLSHGRRLVLPSKFRSGTRLRLLHSTGVAFSAPLRLLSSSRDLVDIQLHDIFDYRYLSPNALAEALSGMTHLRSLSLHFLSTAANQTLIRPLSEKSVVNRVVIHSLSCLKYCGTSGYLDELLARVDASCLADIEITFFNDPRSYIPNLNEFINRTETPKLHRQADIIFSERAISISLTQMCLTFPVLCESPVPQPLLSMTQICSRLSVLHLIEEIRIRVMPSSWVYTTGCEKWVYLFNGLKWFHVAGNSNPFTEIMRPLRSPPALLKLCICELGSRFPPLREAVVSLMVDRRLSGCPVEVEYEQLCIDEVTKVRTGAFSQQVTTDALPDDILLNIFRHYLGHGSPPSWPTLTQVSQRWRQIIFASPRSLDLRLYFTYGTPVLKTLEYWPSFPLIVNYGGSPELNSPSPEDEKNIVVALKRSEHVRSINLTVTSSLVEKISTMALSEPFSELEDLTLLSRDILKLALPAAFRWGPRLRTLHSTRIPIPTLPQLLSPPTSLVDLQLHEIPKLGHFCPEAFGNALSGATHLETLSLHFISLPPRRNHLRLSPSGVSERIVLSALTSLKYRGTSKFLDSFVARIDAPHLEHIDITISSQPTMDASQLGRFLERTEMHISLLQPDVEISPHAISISFPNSSTSTPLRLKIPCEQLGWQLSSMAQVCNQCSPFLFRFKNLGINATRSSSVQDDVDGEQWLELFRGFGGATVFWVAGELTTEILCALGSANGEYADVLPALCDLRVGCPLEVYGPSCDGIQPFLASRRISGRPVLVNPQSYRCHICSVVNEEKEDLRIHLVWEHAYQMVCSYCDDFERLQRPDYDALFREHLASEHVDIPPTDGLRASDLFARFTKLRPPGPVFTLVEMPRFVDEDLGDDETGSSTDDDGDYIDTDTDADTDTDTDTDINIDIDIDECRGLFDWAS